MPNKPPAQFFSKADQQLAESYDLLFVPVGEGPFVRLAPVDRVWHKDELPLSEDRLLIVFPALQRMDPMRLTLDLSQMTDRTIALLNRLRSAREFSLRDSTVTTAGLRQLRLAKGKKLLVPKSITADERGELQHRCPA